MASKNKNPLIEVIKGFCVFPYVPGTAALVANRALRGGLHNSRLRLVNQNDAGLTYCCGDPRAEPDLQRFRRVVVNY